MVLLQEVLLTMVCGRNVVVKGSAIQEAVCRQVARCAAVRSGVVCCSRRGARTEVVAGAWHATKKNRELQSSSTRAAPCAYVVVAVA